MDHVLDQDQPTEISPESRQSPRIGILVVAYNAATTLASVLDRVPKPFRPRISQVFVCDDASDDSTYLVGLGYKQLADDPPITVIRRPSNLGYGGNQKAGLDQGHVRFFTRRGFLRRLRNAGFTVVRHEATGLPLEVITRSNRMPHRLLKFMDRLAVATRPTLFGYQFVFQCESPAQPSVLDSRSRR